MDRSLSTLLGKMLRIDVNSGAPYRIPPTNPFIGRTGVKPEIWAYGFRNPWRFSFDLQSKKRLLIGDVGQDAYEEIDIGTIGGNFGWNIMEGRHCYPIGSTCNQSGKILPIAEVAHPAAEAIIGGFVYRSTGIPALAGYLRVRRLRHRNHLGPESRSQARGNEPPCSPPDEPSALSVATARASST